MGTSATKNQLRKTSIESQDQKQSNFEGLIYQSDKLSSNPSSLQPNKPKHLVKRPSQKRKQLELNQYNSSDTSGKSNLRNDSAMSNFDKLSIKSSRISKLNEQLDKSIKEYQKDQKKNKSQRNSNYPTARKIKPRRKKTQFESVFMGIWIGVTFSIMIVLIVIVQINGLSVANHSQFARDFPTWRGIAIWIFYLWILGFNIYMFDRHKIRYRQFLGIAPDHYPQAVNVYKIAGFQSSIFIVLFLFYVLDITNIYQTPGFQEEYYASISWGIFIGFLCLPLPIFSNKGRYFAFSIVINALLSPFRGVKFADIWLTNQAVSMSIPLKDLHYTICYYTQLDFQSAQNNCSDTNKISTVLIVAVSASSMIILQCIRQGYDNGKFFMAPPFFNALKYSSTLITAVLASYYKIGATSIIAAWLCFAIITTLFSYYWDLKMDWGLLQNNRLHPFLREKLVWGSSTVYYFIVVGNMVLRLTWIVTFSPEVVTFLGNNNLVALVAGIIQIFRRGIWNLIKVENEYVVSISKPPANNSLLEQKAQQLQKKLATVQNSLNLQIKMLKFFRKFEDNRQYLKAELERFNEDDLYKNEVLVQAYNGQFDQQEIKEISLLMDQILKTDTLLKKQVDNKIKQTIEDQSKISLKEELLTHDSNRENPNIKIQTVQSKIQEVESIKAQLKQLQNLQRQSQLQGHQSIQNEASASRNIQ